MNATDTLVEVLRSEGPRVLATLARTIGDAMPESVRDRLNCRHQLIFLLVKQSAYWFDLDPIRIPHMTMQPGPGRRTTSHTADARRSPAAPPGRRDPSRPPKYGPHAREIVAASRYGNGGTGAHRSMPG